MLFTFDDGPHPLWTPQILDILGKYDQKAMFFILGKQVSGNEGILERILDENHILGSHGMNHFPLLVNTDGTYQKEILQVHQLIKDQFNWDVKYFRPPWGVINRKLRTRCEDELGYEFVYWNKDSLDYIWPYRKNINLNHHKENIILMHDGHAYSFINTRKHTLRMLESILRQNVDVISDI